MRQSRTPATLAALALMAAAPLLAGTTSLHAQAYAMDAGSIMFGGSATITRSETSSGGASSSITRIAMSPSAEYFVIPNLSVGGTLTLARTSGEGFSGTTVMAGPSASYYFHSPERALHPFVAVRTQFGRSTTTVGDNDVSTNTTGARGAAGGVYMLAANVGVRGEAFYDWTRQSLQDPPAPAASAAATTRTFGLAFGLSVYLF